MYRSNPYVVDSVAVTAAGSIGVLDRAARGRHLQSQPMQWLKVLAESLAEYTLVNDRSMCVSAISSLNH